VGVGGAGAWTAGLFDRFTEPEIPVAAPYRLEASLGPEGASLSGNAPDAEAAARLRQAFTAATGAPVPETALSVAQGVPDERWVGNMAGALEAVAGLAEWSLSVSDSKVSLAGLAGSAQAAGESRKAIADWSTAAGMTASVEIAVGPRILPLASAEDILAPFALCGPLDLESPPAAGYALGDTITVTGAVETSDDRDALQKALEDTVGDRGVRVETTILNSDLCMVRRVLPPLADDSLTIWLGDGATGQVNLSGIYKAGDNPIVEILAPADMTGLSLWVAVVDNTGSVFNLLPNLKQEAHDITDVGAIVDGQRRIRVLHSLDDIAAGTGVFATTVNQDSFGKSEIVAVLSRTSLFGIRRPKDESVASFAEALAEIVAEEPGNIVSVATRVIDARP
jgi:hypothetical protein